MRQTPICGLHTGTCFADAARDCMREARLATRLLPFNFSGCLCIEALRCKPCDDIVGPYDTVADDLIDVMHCDMCCRTPRALHRSPAAICAATNQPAQRGPHWSGAWER